MKKVIATVVTALLVLLTASPVVANSLTPNTHSPANYDILSIDAYVTTKFTSVGDSIEIYALTMGHSGTPQSTNTVVTADIVHYPENDPLGIITQGEIPSNPVVVDTVVLTPSGLHENDSSIMKWEGDYTVPLDALGGVYGASITVEESGVQATDNPTQVPEKVISEIEQVLQTVDTTWDSANPTMEMKAVFDNLNSSGNALSGGWTEFVEDATAQPGLGDSAQLWNNMIAAGYDNPSYDLEDGAQFLEALMEFLDSDDLDAGMAFLTGLFVYGNEFPLPRTVNDFGPMADYISTFDPIENFTRFSGTENFSAAYDAMLGSNEWDAMSNALDNLSNNTMVFESFQTVLRNIALLSVSTHPDAIIAGFEAWIEPLTGDDYDNMTPFQKLVVSWSQMDVTISDLDGDDFPDEVLWEYELLLNTSEGLQWQAKMDTSYPHVGDGFDDFNGFDVELLAILKDTVEDPAWEQVGDAVNEFGSWVSNASFDRELEWEYDYGDEEDDGGDDSGDDDGDSGGEDSEEDSFQYVVFDDLHPMQTSMLNKHILDLGFELMIDGPWDSQTDYPNDFNMTVTDSTNDVTNVVLTRDADGHNRYFGRFTAESLGENTYSFSQPLESYRPACADQGCTVESSRLEINSLRPGLLEDMTTEVNDEIFLVSAIGVLVNQSETTLVNQPYFVESTTYDAVLGALDGAEIDSAVLRISPGLAESAVSTLSPEGDLEISSQSPSTLRAVYSGNDVDGQLSVTIEPRQEDREGTDMTDDMGSFQGELTLDGDAYGWDASSELSNQVSLSNRGVALITTSGTTNNGLEFSFSNEMPLPGSPACTTSSGSMEGDSEVKLRMSSRPYYYEADDSSSRFEFIHTDLISLSIDWGDGQVDEVLLTGEQILSLEEVHSYSSSGVSDTHSIDVNYEFENGIYYTHQFVFKEYNGFENSDEDGNVYYEGELSTNEEWRYCELNRPEQQATPSAPIINEFITNGPFEVVTQYIGTSDEDGKSNISIVPSHTGAYVSIVQSKHVRASDGETLTGIGLNFGLATTGAIDILGMDILGYFSGLPVYAANSTDSMQSIQIQTQGMNDRHKTIVGHMPLDLSVPFPDMDEIWSVESSTQDLEFNPGESSRTVQIDNSIPLSLIGVVSIKADSEWETTTSDTLTPLGVHFGMVLTNPESLDLTGLIGPGQTTNVALDASLDPASRILAVASPSHGFDPSTIDFSTITEAFSNELLRPITDWPGVETEMNIICESLSYYTESEWQDSTMSERKLLKIDIEHESDTGEYDGTSFIINTDTSKLIETATGQVISQYQTSSSSSSPSEHNRESVLYDLTNLNDGEYEFYTGSDMNSSVNFDLQNDHNEPEIDFKESQDRCGGDDRLDDESVVSDLFDEYFTRFSTIAWGQGTSADLQMPYLSSPVSDYTVIGIAQQGSGETAKVVSGFNFISSQVNPEPPQMENLSLVFTPTDPNPGDVVLLTITDESNNPVEGLSIILTQNNSTMASLLSSETGQASFEIPLGDTKISVSGGQYYPFEITITVTENQSGNDTGLPGDVDGDGYGDSLDVFPNDPNEWLDTDGDGVGDNADEDDDGDGLKDIEEYLFSPATDPLKVDTDGDGYCDGSIDVVPDCVSSDAFPTDASAWNDTDSDGLPDDISGISTTNLVEDSDDDNDGWSDIDENSCGTDALDVNSIPLDTNGNGICDSMDDDLTVPDDTQNETQNDASGEEEDSNADSTQSSTGAIVVGTGIGLVALAVVSVLFLLRSRSSDPMIDDEQFTKEEILFEEFANEVSNPPSRPPLNAVGEMYDGYEAIEFPKNSQKWFYRDPQTGQWVEWT